MLAAHQQSIRVLQGVLVASAILPAVLFAYASWQGYYTTKNVAERQIAQSRDVLTEHALKVFEAVDRTIAEANEIIRDMSDEKIGENAEGLHNRFKKLADQSSQIKSIWIFDRSGHAIVNTLGCVDGFDQDERKSKRHERCIVARSLLASECDAFETFEFADGLFDTRPRLVKCFWKKGRDVFRVGSIRDCRTYSALACGLTI